MSPRDNPPRRKGPPKSAVRDATLVHVHPAETEADLEGPFPLRGIHCPREDEGAWHGRRVISLEVDEAALPLRIRFCRKRPKQGLFGVRCWRGGKDDHGRNLYVVSRELRDELTRADLVSGLRFIPIQVSPGGRTDEFHGLLARRLPWPAAPFGTTGGPCDECGLSFPSFSVYRVFPRPEEPTHWMASPYSPGSIVVDKPTWEQLSGPLKALVGRGRQAVDGWRLGWFPDEQDLAFLPPELQGIAPADPDPPQGTR